MKKLVLVCALIVSASTAFAGPGDVGSVINDSSNSGLDCTMAYSSSDALTVKVDSRSGRLSHGEQMEGSAVVNKGGSKTAKPANYITVKKDGSFWSVAILDEAKKAISSFSFLQQKAGMKATLKTQAFMANETEDPAKYDKLEVSCQYLSIFAG